MRSHMRNLTYTAMAVLAITASATAAEIKPSEVSRLAKAAQVLQETRTTIPQEYWARARCVAVIPDLKKAAFIVGGEYGKGVMSCRAGETWSAPVFLELAKGSWGFQAGAEEVDVVMLVMNESGVQKLLKNKVELGADASVAAGPIGRQGQVATDVSLTAEILAYSRAKGLFAGINLSGGVLRPDEEANAGAYGPGASLQHDSGGPKSVGAHPGDAVHGGVGDLQRLWRSRPRHTPAQHEIPPQATAAVRTTGSQPRHAQPPHRPGMFRRTRTRISGRTMSRCSKHRSDARRSEFIDGRDRRAGGQRRPDDHGEPRKARAAPQSNRRPAGSAQRTGTIEFEDSRIEDLRIYPAIDPQIHRSSNPEIS